MNNNNNFLPVIQCQRTLNSTAWMKESIDGVFVFPMTHATVLGKKIYTSSLRIFLSFGFPIHDHGASILVVDGGEERTDNEQ